MPKPTPPSPLSPMASRCVACAKRARYFSAGDTITCRRAKLVIDLRFSHRFAFSSPGPQRGLTRVHNLRCMGVLRNRTNVLGAKEEKVRRRSH
jgi:hypothetical protein